MVSTTQGNITALAEKVDAGLSGTEPYAAPETYGEMKYDPFMTDIWSLGVIFYGLLSRRYPWDKSTSEDADFQRFLNDNSTYFAHVPVEAAEIIGKMLQPEPRSRASISEVLMDKWIAGIEVCAYTEDHGRPVLSHQHTLRKHWMVVEDRQCPMTQPVAV